MQQAQTRCGAEPVGNRLIHPRFQPRTLREAALLLGGERKLAELLEIDLWLVSRWLGGLGQPPDFVFLRCIDLIESGKQAATAGSNTGINAITAHR